MSDRVTPAYQRRGSGLRTQVMETMIQNVSGFDPDLWVVMDQRDNTLIEEEILHGAGSSKYVYQFSLGGTQVAGISVIGARELAAAYGGIQHSLIGSISKVGSMFVMKSYPHGGQQMGLFVQQIPELAAEQDYYEVVAEIKDVKTGNVTQVEKKEFRLEQRSAETLAKNPGLPKFYERPHYQVIAQSKAFRNGVLSIIPQHVQLEWKQEMLRLSKTDIITASLVDEKRSGVLRYAAAKAIGVDRHAVEALTLDQIMGLSDAAKEGKAEQFMQSAEALGIVLGQEEPDKPRRAAAAQPGKSVAPKAETVKQVSNGAGQSNGHQEPRRETAKTSASVEAGRTMQTPRESAAPGSITGPTSADHKAGEQPRQEATTEKSNPVQLDESGFNCEPLDEFGEAMINTDGLVMQFTDAQQFALWYNRRFFASGFPQALRENNEEALIEAVKHPTARTLIEATEKPVEEPPKEEPQKQEEPKQDDGPKPLVLGMIAKTGRPNWAKYVVDVEAELKTIKTDERLQAWLALNKPTYDGKTAAYGVKIDGIVAAREAEIKKESAPKIDRDLSAANGLIKDLNGVYYQHEYDSIVNNDAVRSMCQRFAKDRPDLTKMIAAAEKESLGRIKASGSAPGTVEPGEQRQAGDTGPSHPGIDIPPGETSPIPIGEEDMPVWDREDPQ